MKEIEEALLAGEVDLAVHSAKDVPAELPERPRDRRACPSAPTRATRSAARRSSTALPEGAVVGTASLRRRAQLLAARPDLDVRDLRGNVDTRLRRLADGDFDAIVLAQAGLDRLGRGGEGTPVDPSAFVPAAGPGLPRAGGTRRDDDDMAAAAASAHRSRRARLPARRSARWCGALDASCHTPVGAHAVLTAGSSGCCAFVGLPDGSQWIRDELEGCRRRTRRARCGRGRAAAARPAPASCSRRPSARRR